MFTYNNKKRARYGSIDNTNEKIKIRKHVKKTYEDNVAAMKHKRTWKHKRTREVQSSEASTQGLQNHKDLMASAKDQPNTQKDQEKLERILEKHDPLKLRLG